MDLERMFVNLWLSLGSRDGRREWLLRERAYTEPHRHHHRPPHIASIHTELQPVKHLLEHPDETFLAGFDHDWVLVLYKDGKRVTTDEFNSARKSIASLSRANAALLVQDRVSSMIIATDGRSTPSGDAAFLRDADRAILGQPWEAYIDYSLRGVMPEYIHRGMPKSEFIAGRQEFLRKLLGKPTIYCTGYFCERYEKSARANIARELAILPTLH